LSIGTLISALILTAVAVTIYKAADSRVVYKDKIVQGHNASEWALMYNNMYSALNVVQASHKKIVVRKDKIIEVHKTTIASKNGIIDRLTKRRDELLQKLSLPTKVIHKVKTVATMKKISKIPNFFCKDKIVYKDKIIYRDRPKTKVVGPKDHFGETIKVGDYMQESYSFAYSKKGYVVKIYKGTAYISTSTPNGTALTHLSDRSMHIKR